MQTISAASKYDGLKRCETLTNEYSLHEDFLLLASYCEKAAKAAYLLEHASPTDEEAKKRSKNALHEAFGRIENMICLIEGYEGAKKDD